MENGKEGKRRDTGQPVRGTSSGGYRVVKKVEFHLKLGMTLPNEQGVSGRIFMMVVVVVVMVVAKSCRKYGP